MCGAFEQPHNSKLVTAEWIGVTVSTMWQVSITWFSEEPCSSDTGLMPTCKHQQDILTCSRTDDAFYISTMFLLISFLQAHLNCAQEFLSNYQQAGLTTH